MKQHLRHKKSGSSSSDRRSGKRVFNMTAAVAVVAFAASAVAVAVAAAGAVAATAPVPSRKFACNALHLCFFIFF